MDKRGWKQLKKAYLGNTAASFAQVCTSEEIQILQERDSRLGQRK